MPFSDDVWNPADPYISADDLTNGYCDCDDDPLDLETQNLANLAVAVGSSILYLLSGRTLTGLRTETVLPQRLGDCTGTWSPVGVLVPACSASVVALEAPIDNVVSILIDGVEPADDEWIVVDHRYVVRLPDEDGVHRHWPAAGLSFSMNYVWGLQAPPFTVEACMELSCMAYKKLRGQRGGPMGLSSVSAGGSSFVKRQTEEIKKAIADFPATERFIGLVNPDMQPSAPWFSSPDFPVGGPIIT